MSAIFKDDPAARGQQVKWWSSRIAIYTALILWAVVCLFPIYWTLTTSFKLAPDVIHGNMTPFRTTRRDGRAGKASAYPRA